MICRKTFPHTHADEQQALDALRKSLGMSRTVKAQILADFKKEQVSFHCPSCGQKFQPLSSKPD